MKGTSVFRSVVGWAFGFSVTVLLIALWGRSVVVDTDTLAESLRPLSGSPVVGEAFAGWMAGELVDSGYPREVVDPAIGVVMESSATASAMDALMSEVVLAAGSSDPAGSSVDVAGLLAPAIPEVTSGLAELGLPATESDVSDVVTSLDPMTIRGQGSVALVGPESPAAARLGTAALLGLVGMIVFGYATVIVSEDRVAAVRGLFSRVAVGGFGFAILLLIGSWITDPRGGRAPIPETISAVASSKWLVPLQVGLVAGLIAASIYFGRRWLRQVGVSRSPGGSPKESREGTLLQSGSR